MSDESRRASGHGGGSSRGFAALAAVLLGSLLFRDKRSEEMWPEVYARQNTGILVSKASAH